MGSRERSQLDGELGPNIGVMRLVDNDSMPVNSSDCVEGSARRSALSLAALGFGPAAAVWRSRALKKNRAHDYDVGAGHLLLFHTRVGVESQNLEPWGKSLDLGLPLTNQSHWYDDESAIGEQHVAIIFYGAIDAVG